MCSSLLVYGYSLEDFDRLLERFVIVYRYLGLPIVVEDGFRLSALFPRDIVL